MLHRYRDKGHEKEFPNCTNNSKQVLFCRITLAQFGSQLRLLKGRAHFFCAARPSGLDFFVIPLFRAGTGQELSEIYREIFHIDEVALQKFHVSLIV